MFIGEGRFSEFHFGAELTKPLLGIMLLDNTYDMLNSLRHISEVHRREIELPQAKVPRSFHEMPDAGGHYERLARNASIMETIAAQFVFPIDKECFCPELGRSGRNGEPSRAAPKYPYVKVKIIRMSLLSLSQATAISR